MSAPGIVREEDPNLLDVYIEDMTDAVRWSSNFTRYKSWKPSAGWPVIAHDLTTFWW